MQPNISAICGKGATARASQAFSIGETTLPDGKSRESGRRREFSWTERAGKSRLLQILLTSGAPR
ncbi:MAG: hypothetical protein C3F11_13845 [Methylocystaceae bacterium]|nr:MAG: hypothetical protein C3F11_13845 [Methylocystaceae bacterium]